jgi:hypothetical protein
VEFKDVVCQFDLDSCVPPLEPVADFYEQENESAVPEWASNVQTTAVVVNS